MTAHPSVDVLRLVYTSTHGDKYVPSVRGEAALTIRLAGRLRPQSLDAGVSVQSFWKIPFMGGLNSLKYMYVLNII